MAGAKGAPRGELGRLAGLHGGHWVVLTGCRKGAVPSALHRRGPAAAEAELDRLVQAFGRDNVYVELLGPRRPARLGPQRRPGPAGRPGEGRGGGDQQRPLRHPGPPPAGHRPGRGQGPQLPGRPGRLAARRGRRPSPLRVRAGGPPGPLPGHGRAGRRARPRPGLRPGAGRAPPARLPGPAGPHRDDLAARAGRPGRDPALRPQGGRADPRGLAPDRLRAGHDRAARLPRLLPDRLGHRRVLPPVGHLLPGPGLGGQLGRLLRDRDHQGRRRLPRPAVRAVPVPGARRAARHRPGHRGRPPRGGHPVRLRSGTAATGPPRWPT